MVLDIDAEGWKISGILKYTGSRVFGHASEGHLEIQIRNRHRILELELDWENNGGSLDAPIHGAMSRDIIESPYSRVQVILLEKNVVLWEGRAEPAAVEVVGNPSKLL